VGKQNFGNSSEAASGLTSPLKFELDGDNLLQ
jgi:hypothetical protein